MTGRAASGLQLQRTCSPRRSHARRGSPRTLHSNMPSSLRPKYAKLRVRLGRREQDDASLWSERGHCRNALFERFARASVAERTLREEMCVWAESLPARERAHPVEGLVRNRCVEIAAAATSRPNNGTSEHRASSWCIAAPRMRCGRASTRSSACCMPDPHRSHAFHSREEVCAAAVDTTRETNTQRAPDQYPGSGGAHSRRLRRAARENTCDYVHSADGLTAARTLRVGTQWRRPAD